MRANECQIKSKVFYETFRLEKLIEIRPIFDPEGFDGRKGL